ncbi:nicotinate phosphoribosyltransferase [Jonquetella anthropi]|uniref:nicotinate phosphoribosyltransferase n=1 Tax=Jonquetella anthropi TaxID=428712 RepID=UPI0023F3A47C|nr:nicotinate phosphoribosyltransferase [Jonquetella anthropi]
MTTPLAFDTMADVKAFTPDKDRLFLSATHEEIISGAVADVYFVRSRDVLRVTGQLDVPVTAEIFARRHGVYAGLGEALRILKPLNVRVQSLRDGDTFESKDTLMRIEGAYGEFGAYESILLGILASSSGWATAARECVEAAGGKPCLCFGARHVHPSVAPVMESIAVSVGGCSAASCILGAKLAGGEPSGTIPHAVVLVNGDTVRVAKAYASLLKPHEPMTVLVDTFKDEAEETLRVAEALGDRLTSIRLDTPSERGGVTPALVREVRWRLDKAGFPNVKIVASGGLDPDRIRILSAAGVDMFGVGSYICHGVTCDMTMDLKEVDGKPIAKRGRLPGRLDNPKLVDVQ